MQWFMNSKEMIKKAQSSLKEQFEVIEDIRDYNQEKVLEAFFDNKVAPEHFYTVSGYGHDDLGREVLDKVYAQVFKAEKALVRIHFVSGTGMHGMDTRDNLFDAYYEFEPGFSLVYNMQPLQRYL